MNQINRINLSMKIIYLNHIEKKNQTIEKDH